MYAVRTSEKNVDIEHFLKAILPDIKENIGLSVRRCKNGNAVNCCAKYWKNRLQISAVIPRSLPEKKHLIRLLSPLAETLCVRLRRPSITAGLKNCVRSGQVRLGHVWSGQGAVARTSPYSRDHPVQHMGHR